MTSLVHFENVARAIDLPNRAVIDGRLETSLTGRTFDNVTPRNGTVIKRVAECDVADVDKAVAAARRAFEDGRWRSLHYREKNAGFGRDRCLHALHKYADLKSVSITIR
jgi:4-(gamma-glutamylamino)butanal dehydrogenase